MKNLNYIFADINELEEFIDNNNIKDSNNILVQIFSGLLNDILCKNIATTIKEKLPQASIIGTTTAGGVVDGQVLDLQIIISFSLFESTKIASKLYLNKGEDKCARQIVDDLVVENTKAIIIFTDGLKTDGEMLLKQISLLHPDLVIAGGKAGDNNKFQRTFVFNENELTEYGCLVASLNGDELIVSNSYMLNCDSIGTEMTVTKSDKGRVYTIDNVPASEIYKKYLGEDISSKLPESGIEYPFLLEREGVTVSRSPIGAFDDGSILYAGNLNEGEKIKFGFANIDMIQDKNFDDYNYFKTLPIEATYIYSCTGRRSLLGKYLDIEFGFLQNLGPTVGFLTFGEYFHGNSINELLNITTTFLSISESNVVHKHKHIEANSNVTTDKSMKVLTHLVRTTSKELQETNNSLELKMLENEKIRKSLSEGQRIAKFGIWEWDLVTNKIWMSDGQMNLFGLTPETFQNSFKEYIHPEDVEMVNAVIERAIKKDELYSITHRIITADQGEVKYIHVDGEVDFDKDGKAVFMKGTAQDVTELIKSQNELETYKNSLELKVEEQTKKRREQEVMLMQQSRLASMGEMIGNIAHQWRQPLNALSLVVGNIKDAFLMQRLDEAYMNKSSEKAYKLIQKMSTTIDDFRDFFKPDKEKKNFSVSFAIEDSLQLIEALLNNSNIEVEKHLDDSVNIDGYHNEFSQVVLNIINNAKDALVANRTDDRLVKIDLSSKNGKAHLCISDNAGGIPENIIDRIFEPYYTTKEQGHGTGLGLYMSKLIIEDHMSGSIRAENIKNSDCEVTGAMFTIEI